MNQNFLGDPVLATIEMRAIPHWHEFLKKYDRIVDEDDIPRAKKFIDEKLKLAGC